MEISLAQLVPAFLAGLAGLAGGACAWFVFARQLVTRAEVEQMMRDRVGRQEQLIDAMRAELVALRGEVIRLGVLLGVERSRDCGSSTGTNETKGR